MADAAYDAVIVGGGTKSIVTAIYLAKYAGMSVGVFEERRELCSGMTTEQSIVPGFVADYHSTGIPAWYYVTVKEDFPDFEEKGGKVFQCPAPLGGIVREDQSCWVVHHRELDPNQEQTAKELTRFASERDAETYLKLWELVKPGTDFYTAFLQEIYNLPLHPSDPNRSPLERWTLNYLAQPDCLIDYTWLVQPAWHAIPMLWESPALASLWLRWMTLAGISVDIRGALDLLAFIAVTPEIGYVQGGTHNVAHAYQRILYENGGKWFSRSEVDKIIIENGAAKGIRLTDGTQIEAKKVVVSGVDAPQLCLRLVGKDHLSAKCLRNVKSLQGNLYGLAWYTWFLHELPKYKAADFNPSINQCGQVQLGSRDLRYLYEEANWRRLGKISPIQGLLVFHHYSITDKTRSPEGKHVVGQDRPLPGATAFSEREWLDFKKKCAQEVINEWQEYAPNMTWDNIIGFTPQTPYDAAGRGLNFAPWGNPGIVDDLPNQLGRFAPSPEMGQFRMPIKNLYATGIGRRSTGASCDRGYACYKAIAEDLGLRKPWEEKGRPF